jgi:cytochrome b561
MRESIPITGTCSISQHEAGGTILDSNRRPSPVVTRVARYTPTAQALHWITATLMFIVLPVAWVMTNMPEAASSRSLPFTLHKSIGLTIVMIVVLRLAWRAKYHAPSFSARLSRWEKGAAVVSHWMLYVVLIGMPISGYLLSATSGHPVSYFGLFSVPILSKSPAIARAATWVHVVVGQWVVYSLIVLHVAATVWHVFLRRDGVLDRMLPEQKKEAELPPERRQSWVSVDEVGEIWCSDRLPTTGSLSGLAANPDGNADEDASRHPMMCRRSAIRRPMGS